MNVLDYLDFETVEQGEINVIEAEKVRDTMGSAMWYSACAEDVDKLKAKLENLKFLQKLKGFRS